MTIVYGYLIAWIAGGVALITTLLLRTPGALLALALALIGFGGAGFLAQGFGGAPAPAPAIAGGAAFVLGALGFAIGRA